MKLRNKKTGEIVQNFDGFTTYTTDWSSGKNLYYTSLTELNEEWGGLQANRATHQGREDSQGQLTGRKAGCSRGRAKIQFNRALGFNYGCGFTLAELCGEEEE